MEKKLAAALDRDDAAEDAGMHPDNRETCHTHQCWAHECADHPMHTRPSAAR
ncbi:hypothetical protein ABT093_09770 [Kitasatospora sp. NPDC002551]|uniref:hypothetical protein n=1 Tax=Kitasatospora sp. NPDC002551 TaxID=3154539 RepID=UPI00332E68B2